MIDALIKIIDRLIQLATYKEKREQKAFDEIVKMLFKQLQEIHADYLQMLESTSILILQEREVSKAITSLRQKRIELEGQRQLVKMAILVCAKNHELSKFMAFFDSVGRYFMADEDDVAIFQGITPSSAVLGILDGLMQADRFTFIETLNDDDPKVVATRAIALIQDLLRKQWSSVSEEYVKLLSTLI